MAQTKRRTAPKQPAEQRKPRRRGGPLFVPTDEQREMVRALVGYGMPQAQICQIINKDPKTLRRAFPDEISNGHATAKAKVAQTLFKMATSGRHASATIFWLKTQGDGDFREPPRVIPTWSDADRMPSRPLGKKEQQALDARTAGLGSEWGSDLDFDFDGNLPN